VGQPVGRDGATRRQERLRAHLTAVEPPPVVERDGADEAIVAEVLDREHLEERQVVLTVRRTVRRL
jgi:hypothetical protein